MKPKYEADRLDWKIIALQQRDARMTNAEIGKTIDALARLGPVATSRVLSSYLPKPLLAPRETMPS